MTLATAASPAVTTDTDTHLHEGELTFPEVLFQALASAAPALGVTLAVVVGANFAGGALPFSLLLALGGILLVATCIAQMAQRFPTAGGFYPFVSRGLHPAFGAMVAWLYLIIWIVFPSTLFLPFGEFVATTLHNWFGWGHDPVWIVSALICIGAIYLIVRAGAKLSTKVSILLGMVEFLIVGALAVTLIAKAGSHNTVSVFGTSHADVKGFVGFSGVFGAMIYAIYAFVGFENVVPLAEEAKNPRRNVMLAALLSPVILGAFIIFCTYAVTVYFGADRFSSFTTFNGGDAWIGVAKEVWHTGWYLLLFALLNSCVASANAATSAATRHVFAMARIRLLPQSFARLEEQTGTPTLALGTLMAISVVVTLVAGLWTSGPLQGFAFLGTIETVTAILLYTLVALSCFVYFLRTRATGYNLLLHGIVPVAAVAVMIPSLMTAVGVGSGVFRFISPLPHPYDYAAWISVAWLVVGIAFAAWQWRAHPDRVRATERVFVEETG